MTGRESQIPTWHLEHSLCHKVCASDAVQSVDNTAARPNDPRRQTAGRVVPVCVCVCTRAITLRMYVTFWQLQMSIAARLFASVCVCVCVSCSSKQGRVVPGQAQLEDSVWKNSRTNVGQVCRRTLEPAKAVCISRQ